MRLSSRRTKPYALRLPASADPGRVTELLRRYDPDARQRRRTLRLTGTVLQLRDGELVVPPAEDVLARALGHHLGGSWRVPPPRPDERQEPIEDLVRVYVAGGLLPSELATLLRPFRPGVVIRADPKLDLFWFDDADSELTVSAWTVQDRLALPLAARELSTAEELYEVGIDDSLGPTPLTAQQAWEIAKMLEIRLDGIPVDRYGFRLTGAGDLLPAEPEKNVA